MGTVRCPFCFVKVLSVIICLVSVVQSFSQKELKEVIIIDSLQLKKENQNVIRRQEIVESQAEDVGQVLQKMAGVNIKSYGGLGGMKTISVRSLGSQHTSLIIDGFSISNAQTGQVNLANLQVDNIEQVQLVTGGSNQFFTPVSALTSGSSINIETFEATYSPEKFKVRLSSKCGSFNQFDEYLTAKYSRSNFFIGAYGKFRFSDGSYPYSFQNGKFLYKGTRFNNAFKDAYAGMNLGYRTKKAGFVNFGIRANTSDQELPGAVILYSDLASQTLSTNEQRVQASYTKYIEDFSFRIYSTFSRNNLYYEDTTFLNNEGGIFSNYRNDQLQGGLNLKYSFHKAGVLFAGTEQHFDKLKSSLSGLNEVERDHNFSVLGFQNNNAYFQVVGQVSAQFVQDRTNQDSTYTFKKYNPFIEVESKDFGKRNKLRFSAFYKNSYRMPSFNELYYNNIGNTLLKPEEANQFSFGMRNAFVRSKFRVDSRLNVYRNKVKNKIVAIPTKNLFVWSMQNVGDVEITGLEALLDIHWKISNSWQINFSSNYTFQQTIDLSDKFSPTYRHQIAYIPLHSANADLVIKWKECGFRFGNFYNSYRYSLNENIDMNKVDGFIVSDAAIFNSFKRGKSTFRIQFTCKNIFNSSYSIVRYYVMPGRNYLLTFSYAFN